MGRRILLIGFALSVAIAGGYRVGTEEFKGWNHVKSMVMYSKALTLHSQNLL